MGATAEAARAEAPALARPSPPREDREASPGAASQRAAFEPAAAARLDEEIAWNEDALRASRELAESLVVASRPAVDSGPAIDTGPRTGESPAPLERTQAAAPNAVLQCGGESASCGSGADCCAGLSCAGGVAGYGIRGQCRAPR